MRVRLSSLTSGERSFFNTAIGLSIMEGYAGVSPGTWWKKGKSAIREVKETVAPIPTPAPVENDEERRARQAQTSVAMELRAGIDLLFKNQLVDFFLAGVVHAAKNAIRDPTYRQLRLTPSNVDDYVDIDWMDALTKSLGATGPLFYSVGVYEKRVEDAFHPFSVGRILKRLRGYSGLSPGAYSQGLRLRRRPVETLDAPIGGGTKTPLDLMKGVSSAEAWTAAADLLNSDPGAMRQFMQIAKEAIASKPGITEATREVFMEILDMMFRRQLSEKEIREVLKTEHGYKPAAISMRFGKGFANLFSTLRTRKMMNFLLPLVRSQELGEDVGIQHRMTASRRRVRLSQSHRGGIHP